MAQRKVESGHSRRICKAQLEQMVLMEKMEVKERQFQRHQMLQDQLVHKVYKARKVRREIKVMQVHLAQRVLPDQLVLQVQLDHKDHQAVEAEELLVLQELQVQPALREQRDQLVRKVKLAPQELMALQV
jgi:hypothetical protein